MPHQLKLVPDFSDYNIYGLSTHLKDYKLCWFINNVMDVQLVRHPDLIISGDPDLKFSLFTHIEFTELVDLFLISNFDKHIAWFSKASHFHYFFIIRGNPLKSQLLFFENSLKTIPQMLLVTPLSPDERKLAQPLLTDFELHLTEVSAKEKEELKSKAPKRVPIRGKVRKRKNT